MNTSTPTDDQVRAATAAARDHLRYAALHLPWPAALAAEALDHLDAAALGLARAVLELAAQTAHTEEPMPVEIVRVETRPEPDPYHLNPLEPTRTVLTLYPAERRLVVTQHWNDNTRPDPRPGAINLDLTDPRPDEDALRDYLADRAQPLLRRVCDGYAAAWGPAGPVSQPTLDAAAALAHLTAALADLPPSDWTLSTCADYLDGSELAAAVHPDTDDDRLEALADTLEAYADREHVVLADNPLDALRALRAQARAAA